MRHVVDMKDLSRKDLETIIEKALYFKKIKHPVKTLAGMSIVNVFFEASTRTRMSFQKAQSVLGANVLNFDPGTSSLQKGETDIDTLLTLQSMDVDAFVIRISQNGGVEKFAELLDKPVINAGDGTNEHPTQALLDLVTMNESFGKNKLKVAIIGDILHSRVARSLTEGVTALGGEVRICGPEDFVPAKFDGASIITHNLEEALDGVDVVYSLRVQKERIEELYDDLDDFFRKYQINEETIKLAPKHAILMHPGPFNRNVEVSDGIVYSERSRILEQVRNGVYARMAVMEMAIGANENIQSLQETVA